MKKFTDYKNEAEQVGLGGKVKVEGGNENKPPQGKKASPYKTAGAEPGSPTLLAIDDDGKKGLGAEATPSLANPETNIPMGKKPPKGAKKVTSKTKSFKEDTIEKMLARCKPITETLQDACGQSIVPIPAEALEYAANLAIHHNMMSRLVREVKKQGGFDQLLAEMKEQVDSPPSIRFPKRNVHGLEDEEGDEEDEESMGLGSEDEDEECPPDDDVEDDEFDLRDKSEKEGIHQPNLRDEEDAHRQKFRKFRQMMHRGF